MTTPAALLDQLIAQSCQTIQDINTANDRATAAQMNATRMENVMSDDVPSPGDMLIDAKSDLLKLAKPSKALLTNLQQAWRDLENYYTPIFGGLKAASELAKKST